MLRGRLLANFQDCEHEGGDTRSQGGIKDNDIKIKIQDHSMQMNSQEQGSKVQERIMIYGSGLLILSAYAPSMPPLLSLPLSMACDDSDKCVTMVLKKTIVLDGSDAFNRQLRQEEVKIRALDNYEQRKAKVEAKRMDVIIYIQGDISEHVSESSCMKNFNDCNSEILKKDQDDGSPSSDPFGFYDALNKKSNFSESIPHPPGFTPPAGDVNVNLENVNDVGFAPPADVSIDKPTDDPQLEKEERSSSKSENIGVINIKTGGSILDVMENVIKVGLGQSAKKRWIQEITRKHLVNFISIQDTKMEDIGLFSIKALWGSFSFDFVHSPSVGNSGGILCVWDPNLFTKDDVTLSDSFVAIRAGESSSHLFFSCNVARLILNKISTWWILEIPDVASYDDWFLWFSSLRLGKGIKDVLEGIFYVMCLGLPISKDDIVNISLVGLPNKYQHVSDIIIHREPFSDLKMVRSMLTKAKMRLKSMVRATSIDSSSSLPRVLLANSNNNTTRFPFGCFGSLRCCLG
nr:RNA-directed DNA polymerase, eukaryota, reverse transcriptase zinc-binding domain protein [Tanacetum cinerariifolium]